MWASNDGAWTPLQQATLPVMGLPALGLTAMGLPAMGLPAMSLPAVGLPVGLELKAVGAGSV